MLESNELYHKMLIYKLLYSFRGLLFLVKEVKFFIDSPGDLM